MRAKGWRYMKLDIAESTTVCSSSSQGAHVASTRPAKAHYVPKQDCGAVQDKEWRRTKGLSLKQCTRADRRAAPRWHVHTGRARAPTGRRQAHKQGCTALRRAQGDAGLHSGCQLRRCKRRQGAAPRSWRPRLQEQKVWSARGEAGAAARRGKRRAHGMASRLGPGRGRTGWKAGPGEGGNGCSSAEHRDRLACSAQIVEKLFLFANSERPPT